MRTLMTQMRLRRAIHTFDQVLAGFDGGPNGIDHLRSGSRRVVDRMAAVREAWQQEAAGTAGTLQPGLRRYIAGKLSQLDQLAAELALPGERLDRLASEFQDCGLTLLLTLRGLEDSSDEELVSWFGATNTPLGRTA